MPYQKTKEGRLVNEVTLGDGYPLSNDKQPLKVGGEASIINVSSPTPDGSVDGEVEIKGKLKAKDTFIQGDLKVFSDSDTNPQYRFQSRQGLSCQFILESAANTLTQFSVKNNQGSWHLKRLASTTSLQFSDGTNTPLILDGDNVEFTNLTDGSITIDSFVDEDNMSSNSATKIPTQQSVKAYVDNEVAGLVDSAPAALDTLNELAAALNDDASFSTTVTNSLATKLPLAGGTLTGALTIHTATDAMLNFKASDDSWSYMQFLQNDGDRIAYIGTDSDQDRLIIAANENGANEVQIDTTTVDINANVDISGTITNAEWNGDVIASAYLDSDTAHLSTDQTFTGQKTFTSTVKLLAGSPTLVFKDSTDDDDHIIEFRDESNNLVHTIRTNDNTGGGLGDSLCLGSVENKPLQLITQNATRMVIDGSGNVGIGTTSPQADLHINNTSGTALYITSSDSNPTNSGSIRFAEIADGSNYYVEQKYNGNSNKLSFNSEAVSDILTVMRTGNVGINIATPTTTLDVEGTVSYKHTSLSADSDDLDVSGVTVVECTPSGTNRLGGLTGGVQGQILYILKVDSGLGRIIIEHNEGTGNQDIFLSGGSDVMLSSRGGMTLYCNGTSWFALDK